MPAPLPAAPTPLMLNFWPSGLTKSPGTHAVAAGADVLAVQRGLRILHAHERRIVGRVISVWYAVSPASVITVRETIFDSPILHSELPMKRAPSRLKSFFVHISLAHAGAHRDHLALQRVVDAHRRLGGRRAGAALVLVVDRSPTGRT